MLKVRQPNGGRGKKRACSLFGEPWAETNGDTGDLKSGLGEKCQAKEKSHTGLCYEY